MDQHPMPRQITTFEFKLIGFLTLKQFIYLAVFLPSAFIVYKIFPIPILNIFFAAIVGGVGLAFAFVPINERPLDVWIKNLFKRLASPTQYIYQKQNESIYFLKNLFFLSDPHRVMTHIESQEKLSAYLAKTKTKETVDMGKQNINQMLEKPNSYLVGRRTENMVGHKEVPTSLITGEKKPFFAGEIKNHKLMPIPGILIYVKDEKGEIVRLLKTNPHGIFATFNPVVQGEYIFEIKDPKQSYFFDTIKLKVDDRNPKPIEIFSKELL